MSSAAVDTRHRRDRDGAEDPALNFDTGELFACGEKFDFVGKMNGRGDWIRTNDPLLPKQMQSPIDIS